MDKPKRGARQSRNSIANLFRAWWAHHRSSLQDSYQRLWLSPLQTALTLLVVAIALSLPTILFVGLSSLQGLGQNWQNSSQMSVFLVPNTSLNDAERFREQLQSMPEIESVALTDADTGLAQFEQFSGVSEALNGLDENPLSHVLTVVPAAGLDTPEKLELLQTQLSNLSWVDEVQLDLLWLRKLFSMIDLAERIVLGLAALLALGVLLIVGNTIGLAIENRRQEIIVAKLVGATNSFVRRPFLYTGFFYGLGGGLLASLLVLLLITWLSDPVAELALQYASDYALSGFESEVILVLLLASAGLGWLGAWLAVGRHLRAIEPT